MITLYHGSNTKITNIELSLCNPYKDFGQAFYLTTDKEQAMDVACARVDIFGGEPIVNVFHFDEKQLTDGTFTFKSFDAYTEEWADFSLDQEKAFLNAACCNENSMMIACIVDGRIAGNCQISFSTGMKERHRASVAIALLQEFWNLGIGTKMFEEMIHLAGERSEIRQIELDYIEGNSRARSLYEKMGFRITGVKPDAIRMKDGSFVNEYMMVKKL